MPRYAKPMSAAEFIEELRLYLGRQTEFLDEFDAQLGTDEGVLAAAAVALHDGEEFDLFPKVFQDWSKIDFYPENTEFLRELGTTEGTGLYGVITLPSGFTFFAGLAGGDWEEPLFLIMYHDGKTFRGYIPVEGNVFNRSTKSAFGNDETADAKAFLKQFGGLPALQGKTQAELEALIEGDLYASVSKYLKIDKSAIIADIESRIILRV